MEETKTLIGVPSLRGFNRMIMTFAQIQENYMPNLEIDAFQFLQQHEEELVKLAESTYWWNWELGSWKTNR